jgi:hypothetical protein
MGLGNLRESIERAKKYHTQLIVVFGESASQLLEHAASSDDLPIMNLSLALSERLIDFPRQDRSRSASSVFTELIEEQQAQELLIDHLEILFDRSLSIDPLKLLQNNAKNITLVVVWPGEKNASSLTYAIPSHPEYRFYKVSKFDETIFIEVDKKQ